MNNETNGTGTWEKIRLFIFPNHNGNGAQSADEPIDRRNYIESLPIDSENIEQGITSTISEIKQRYSSVSSFPWRWHFLKTKQREKNEPGLNYDMRSWYVGLADGAENVLSSLNPQLIEVAIKEEKIRTYPFAVKQAIAAAQAKIFSIGIERKHYQTIINDLKKRRTEQLKKLKQDEADQQKKINEQQNNQLDKKATEFAQFFSGLFLLLAGVTLVIADIALSITVVYAFGIVDVESNVPLPRTILSIDKWKEHWDVITLVIGIAYITFIFKLVYEMLVRNSEEKVPLAKKLILGGVSIIALITIGLLAWFRAEYVISEMKELFSGKSLPVNEQISLLTMFCIALLFPLMSAICLSEGMFQVIKSLTSVTESFLKFLDRIKNRVTSAVATAKWNALAGEITQLKREIKVTEDGIDKTKHALFELEKDVILKKSLIKEWKGALKNYEKRWEAIEETEVYLYLHGWNWGQKYYRTHNPYKRAVYATLENISRPQTGKPDQNVI